MLLGRRGSGGSGGRIGFQGKDGNCRCGLLVSALVELVSAAFTLAAEVWAVWRGKRLFFGWVCPGKRFCGDGRTVWLGAYCFGGRVLCCWGDVEAAVVAAGLASRGRNGNCRCGLLVSALVELVSAAFTLAAEVWAVWRGRTDLLRGLVWSVLQEGGDGGAMAGMARRCRF